VEYHGSCYDFAPVGVSPKPIQGGNVPIWIGGTGPAAIRTTAARATGNILWSQDLDEVVRLSQTLRAARADLQIAASIYYDPDLEKSSARARAMFELGVDRILLSPPGNTDKAVEWLSWFADETFPDISPESVNLQGGTAV
jgi:alkanesulfonate monooxygenase SsuD/methylene tetrahydromethanopterin reductase-like flavin-dependent oxidoreductase (luciferase family)